MGVSGRALCHPIGVGWMASGEDKASTVAVFNLFDDDATVMLHFTLPGIIICTYIQMFQKQ